VNTSQITRAVPRSPEPFCQGISANVDMSGIRYWSLSAIRVKPSIDDPSNQVPCLTEPSSWWIGIVTALTWPMMSVNWSWMKRMPLSLAALICAAGSLSATWPPCTRAPGRLGETAGRSGCPMRRERRGAYYISLYR
jgi:hypothetical protein